MAIENLVAKRVQQIKNETPAQEKLLAEKESKRKLFVEKTQKDILAILVRGGIDPSSVSWFRENDGNDVKEGNSLTFTVKYADFSCIAATTGNLSWYEYSLKWIWEGGSQRFVVVLATTGTTIVNSEDLVGEIVEQLAIQSLISSGEKDLAITRERLRFEAKLKV